MKNFTESVILLLVISGGVVLGNLMSPSISNTAEKVGQTFGAVIPEESTLAGSSSNLCRLPNAYVEADATSTEGLLDGCEVTQRIVTNGLDNINLQITVKPLTATSTLSIRQQSSQDGVNWYDIITPTSTIAYNASSTLAVFPKSYIIEYPAVVATSSSQIQLDVKGSNYTRLMFYGTDLSTDPNDGVKAWIELIKQTEVN